MPFFYIVCKLHDIPSEIGHRIFKPCIVQCLKCVVLT